MAHKDIRKEPTWRLALRFGLIFVVVVIIIQTLWELVASGNLHAVSDSFKTGQWVEYVIAKIIIGVVYGFTMAYFTKKKAQK